MSIVEGCVFEGKIMIELEQNQKIIKNLKLNNH